MMTATMIPPVLESRPLPLVDLLPVDGPRPTWLDPEPTVEAFAEALGFELGADGELAELLTAHDDERRAFEWGHNAGDDHLWRIDPSYAADRLELARALAKGVAR